MGARRPAALRGGVALLVLAAVVPGAAGTTRAYAGEQGASPVDLAGVLPDAVLADLSASETRAVDTALASPAAVASVPVALMSTERGRLVVTRLEALPARARALAAVLADQPSVEAADVDTTVRATGTVVDPYAGYQWPLARLQSRGVWSTVRAARDPVGSLPVIAVIDTGLQGDHPDLQGLSVAGYDFVDAGATAPGASIDPHGHGTHVSGIIGATVENGVGVAGLLPDARIMPVRVLDASGVGDSSTVAQGMVWAVDHGAEVLSMSLGGDASTLMQSAADYAEAHGVLVVAAAGNDGAGADAVSYPCAYPTVLCVGATTQTDEIAPFSTHGAQVDIAAPGDNVLSTYRGSNYVYMSGTSMATPYAAAAAAFAWSGHRGWSPSQLRDRLTATADDLGAPGRDDFFGAGLVDPLAAFSAAAVAPPSTPSSFSATLTGQSVTFIWGTAFRATGFTVRASVDGAAATDVLTTSATTAGTTVQAGSSYAFTLVATNEGGSSPALTQLIAVRPSAPAVTGTGPLTWSPVPGATSYAVWRDGEPTPLATVSDSSYAPSVPPGITHVFAVTAAGPTGVSDASNDVTVSSAAIMSPSPAAAPTAAPGAVTAAAVDTVLIDAPRRLLFGSSAVVSARTLGGGLPTLGVVGPCSLVGRLVRARRGTGVCTLTAKSPASPTFRGATASVTVTLARAHDSVTVQHTGRLAKSTGVTVRLRARSGGHVGVVTTGPCTLRKGVLRTRGSRGACVLRITTAGSRNWEPVVLLQVFAVTAERTKPSRR